MTMDLPPDEPKSSAPPADSGAPEVTAVTAAADDEALQRLRAQYVGLANDAAALVLEIRELVRAQTEQANAMRRMGEAAREVDPSGGESFGQAAIAVDAAAQDTVPENNQAVPQQPGGETMPSEPSFDPALRQANTATDAGSNLNSGAASRLPSGAIPGKAPATDPPMQEPARLAAPVRSRPPSPVQNRLPDPSGGEANAGAEPLAATIAAGSAATAQFATETVKAYQAVAVAVQEMAQQLAALREQLANITSQVNATASSARTRAGRGGYIA